MVRENLFKVLVEPLGRSGALVNVVCYAANDSFFLAHLVLRSQKLGPTGSVNGCLATK